MKHHRMQFHSDPIFGGHSFTEDFDVLLASEPREFGDAFLQVFVREDAPRHAIPNLLRNLAERIEGAAREPIEPLPSNVVPFPPGHAA